MASSESEHSDTESADVGIELGFVKPLDREELWRLHRCYFPSKVGGKPAWLDPRDLPTSDDLKCDGCEKIMVLLLQIYAPNDDNENAFHRTENCYEHNSNLPFKVFRCQLRRVNEFYAVNPPDYESSTYYKPCKEFCRTCYVCGCAGNKLCSRCHKVSYCCKHHQALHWKDHKRLCGKGDANASPSENLGVLDVLFPEHEVVMENEEALNESYDAPISENYTENVRGSFSPSELEQYANLSQADEQFSLFRKVISSSTDQILRYDKGGTPLWCSDQNKIMQDNVPKCKCGAVRHFEFQVMPQLLNHLSVQSRIEGLSIDWGTLAIYTCSVDCQSVGQSYFKEYLHKQDYAVSANQ